MAWESSRDVLTLNSFLRVSAILLRKTTSAFSHASLSRLAVAREPDGGARVRRGPGDFDVMDNKC